MLEEMDVDAINARKPADRHRRRARAHERARVEKPETLRRRARSARTPASRSLPPSTSSISNRSTTWWSAAAASRCARRFRTGFCSGPTKWSTSTSRSRPSATDCDRARFTAREDRTVAHSLFPQRQPVDPARAGAAPVGDEPVRQRAAYREREGLEDRRSRKR